MRSSCDCHSDSSPRSVRAHTLSGKALLVEAGDPLMDVQAGRYEDEEALRCVLLLITLDTYYTGSAPRRLRLTEP